MGLCQIACDRNVIVSSESTVAKRGAEHLGRRILWGCGLEAKDNVLISEPIIQSFSISIAKYAVIHL